MKYQNQLSRKFLCRQYASKEYCQALGHGAQYYFCEYNRVGYKSWRKFGEYTFLEEATLDFV